LAAPAIAQSQPEVKWRLPELSESLDTIYGAAEYLAKRVAEATDNKFQIRVFAAGEIVPAFRSSTRSRTTRSRWVTAPAITLSARIRHSPSIARSRSA
jgi:hypothetical protein